MTVKATGRPSGRKVKCLLFDLDDTLYRSEEVHKSVKEHIQRYIAEKLGITEDVEATTTRLYLNYGTTLAGLVAEGHTIDYDDWHQFVHYGTLNYDSLLHPDIRLREILSSADVPKYILTNADRVHTQRCLNRLGISDLFQGIFDFESLRAAAAQRGVCDGRSSVLCKPNPKAYSLVLDILGFQPSEVLFLDDSARNIASAHSLGLMTGLVGTDVPTPGADFAVPTLHSLPKVVPELFSKPGESTDAHTGEHAEHNPLVAVAAS